MKKFLVASFFLGLASMAQAAFIQCVPGNLLTVDQGTGQTSIQATCSPAAGGGAGSSDDNLSGDGWTVTSIQLRVNGTMQDANGTTGQNFAVQFTTSNTPAGTATCLASGNADGNGNATASCAGFSGIVGVSTDVVGAFVVTVTGAAGSTPLPAHATATVFYQVTAEYNTPPPPTVPEPSTYAMMAAGLIGFFVVRRKG